MHTIIAYFFVGQHCANASSKLSSFDLDTNTSVLLYSHNGDEAIQRGTPQEKINTQSNAI